jgi:hypothetical protein
MRWLVNHHLARSHGKHYRGGLLCALVVSFAQFRCRFCGAGPGVGHRDTCPNNPLRRVRRFWHGAA